MSFGKRFDKDNITLANLCNLFWLIKKNQVLRIGKNEGQKGRLFEIKGQI